MLDSMAPVTVTVDENGTCNTVLMDSVMYPPYNTRRIDGKDRGNDNQNAIHRRNDDGIDKNDAHKIEEVPLQHIVNTLEQAEG